MGQAQTPSGAVIAFDAAGHSYYAINRRDRRLYGRRTARQFSRAPIFDAQERLDLRREASGVVNGRAIRRSEHDNGVHARRLRRVRHDVSQRKALVGRGAAISMRRMKPPQSGQLMNAV
jgi:hypothetical protein